MTPLEIVGLVILGIFVLVITIRIGMFSLLLDILLLLLTGGGGGKGGFGGGSSGGGGSSKDW